MMITILIATGKYFQSFKVEKCLLNVIFYPKTKVLMLEMERSFFPLSSLYLDISLLFKVLC